MFTTYKHAEERCLGEILGDPRVQHWQFVEQEMHWPWFYVELVRDHGNDQDSRMLLIPAVPIFQRIIEELDDRSWFARAYAVSPGYLTGSKHWLMEPLLEVSVAHDEKYNHPGYVYTVEGGRSYTAHPAGKHANLRTTQVIFSAGKHLRA